MRPMARSSSPSMASGVPADEWCRRGSGARGSRATSPASRGRRAVVGFNANLVASAVRKLLDEDTVTHVDKSKAPSGGVEPPQGRIHAHRYAVSSRSSRSPPRGEERGSPSPHREDEWGIGAAPFSHEAESRTGGQPRRRRSPRPSGMRLPPSPPSGTPRDIMGFAPDELRAAKIANALH
jgi:hypothetical protein